jgi:glucose/arabinose dehydrogenase
VGFDWHPLTKELYFTDNGRDWLSEDLPEDELNRVTKLGQHFGFPYCHQGTFTDRELGWGRSSMSLKSRSPWSVRTPRRWACAFTRAKCFQANIAT